MLFSHSPSDNLAPTPLTSINESSSAPLLIPSSIVQPSLNLQTSSLKLSIPSQKINFTTNRYRLRCTAHELYLNDELIPYNQQILNLGKFYIIKTSPNSQLKTPIILHRNKQIDTLDRRLFTKKFVFQIVKSLEICSFNDASFICERIPKQVRYFVNVINGITLFRWKLLLLNDSFFITLYSCLQYLITKKSLMSPLRKDLLEELLKQKLTNCHSRLFYILENLVLQNEDLRTALTNLNKNIVIEQMQRKRFFQLYLLTDCPDQTQSILSQSSLMEDSQCQQQQQSQNLIYEDNLSISSDKSINNQQTNQKKTKHHSNTILTKCPQQLLQNTINIIRSSIRLKLSKQFICKKVINKRLLLIIKQFFKQYFQTQKQILLEVICIIMEMQPLTIWEVVFQEGKNWKNRNLRFLQMIVMKGCSGSDNMNRIETHRQVYSQQNQQVRSLSQLSFNLLSKFINLPASEQRRKFIQKIINSFSNNNNNSFSNLDQQLQILLSYLQSLLRESNEMSSSDGLREIMQLWMDVVDKVSILMRRIKSITITRKQYNKQSNNSNKISVKNNSLSKGRVNNLIPSSSIMIQQQQQLQQESSISSSSASSLKTYNNKSISSSKSSSSMLSRTNNNSRPRQQISQSTNNKSKITINSTNNKQHNLLQRIHLPIPKLAVITLIKIYKLLIANEKVFNLGLNQQHLNYLLSITKHRKGIIQGARLQLIQLISKQSQSQQQSSSLIQQ